MVLVLMFADDSDYRSAVAARAQQQLDEAPKPSTFLENEERDQAMPFVNTKADSGELSNRASGELGSRASHGGPPSVRTKKRLLLCSNMPADVKGCCCL